jgi:hypothetical protein
MPRYNLNHEDVDIIVDALNKRSDVSWIPKDQDRIRRLILRLQNKINTTNQNLDTTPVKITHLETEITPVVYDDQIWSFYNNKDE